MQLVDGHNAGEGIEVDVLQLDRIGSMLAQPVTGQPSHGVRYQDQQQDQQAGKTGNYQQAAPARQFPAVSHVLFKAVFFDAVHLSWMPAIFNLTAGNNSSPANTRAQQK